MSANMIEKTTRSIIFLYCLFGALPLMADTDRPDDEPEKAVEGDVMVLRKLFPKRHKLELGVDIGTILNQSYISTMLVQAGGAYYFSESTGIGLLFAFAGNSDKDTRGCIESFYNDPDYNLGAQCYSQDPEGEIYQSENGNMGPAYVPIRVIERMIAAEFLWTPVYGKQILLLGSTSYFDIQLSAGGGMAFSTFYSNQPNLRGDSSRPSRGPFPGEGTAGPTPGTPVDEEDAQGLLWGDSGRPQPEANSNPLLTLGAAQKFHFFKRFTFRIELKNYTLLATQSGFDNFLAIFTGLGVRF